MLRVKMMVFSVITSLALSGCSKNESVPDTVNTTDDISVESKKIETELNTNPNTEVAPEAEILPTVETHSKLVQYTVSDGEYSELCGFKNSEGKIVIKAE